MFERSEQGMNNNLNDMIMTDGMAISYGYKDTTTIVNANEIVHVLQMFFNGERNFSRYRYLILQEISSFSLLTHFKNMHNGWQL